MYLAIVIVIVVILCLLYALNRGQPKRPRVVLYKANGCPACVDFLPTWNKLKTIQSITAKVDLVEYEAAKMPKDASVSSFPTVRLYKAVGNPIEYDGDRTLVDLVSFIHNNTN
jgi:hypothetical protein